MPRGVIHARKTATGLRFRVWSTISEGYYTPELDQSQLKIYLLAEAISETISTHRREVHERIDRAIEKGTSSMIDGPRPLDDPWDEKS